jgi:type IV pilus assembly protein PilM
MIGFVQNIFAPPSHPIGVDFGSDSLRLAQVQQDGDDFKLLAAASAEIPPDVRGDAEGWLQFFADSARHLLTHGKFRGRRAVLGLPSVVVHTHHLALEPVSEEALKGEVIRALKTKLPFDPAQALIRHTVAGKTEGELPRIHVVAMAADTEWVNKFLAAARQAKLDVIGLNVQPAALLDCFANVYRRTSEQRSVRMYVDFGGSGTRVMIAQGTRLLFGKNIPFGGDHLTRSVARGLGISLSDARTLRIKLCAGSEDEGGRVMNLCKQASEDLVLALDQCRREHEVNFPELRVQRAIFVGGEARLEELCQHIADRLKLQGQTGDSLCRMTRNSRIGIESAIDRRHPQPAWAAAIGLSMGPNEPTAAEAAE